MIYENAWISLQAAGVRASARKPRLTQYENEMAKRTADEKRRVGARCGKRIGPREEGYRTELCH